MKSLVGLAESSGERISRKTLCGEIEGKRNVEEEINTEPGISVRTLPVGRW